MAFQSKKRLYLSADGQVVEEGDERAATLLVGEGGQLSDEDAAKYGLLRDAPADGIVKTAVEATPQDASKSADRADVPAAESADGSASKSKATATKAVAAPEGNK